ncbi:MAG: molybdopterin molybdotransferase MoeA [Bacteroidales bacterium]|nr:molybdopterin molybdotransferase MoeA [Bacteroidales bacterium]MDD3665576.1 molybdopterin molybdotransferase MoeA [Bacteroidales bacterium]
MHTLDQAREIVLSQVQLMGVERVQLSESLNRRLAAPILSDMEMPPFRKAAVDGYACLRSDLDKPIRILGVVAAGTYPETRIEEGTCMKIMTGAPVPAGADTIIMVEHAEIQSDGLVRFVSESTSSNICETGEDCHNNEVLVEMGTRVAPHHVAIMAMAGVDRPAVYCRPRVSIVVTGDELVEPGQEVVPSAIRNSNGWQLIAQVEEAGAQPLYHGIVSDHPDELSRVIENALKESDVIVLTGGVSLGDFDFVPLVLKRLGATIAFQELAVQPGKPTLFARLGKALVFGLPGNPVSTLLQFKFLIEPLVETMTGGKGGPEQFFFPMGVSHQRKKPDRQSFFPVSIRNGEVFPVPYNGSAHIRAFASAQGVVSFSIGQTRIEKGDRVVVTLLS